MTGATGRVLLDGRADRRLRRDGFVVLPFLDVATVTRLREQFGEAFGWDGSGFHTDLLVEDSDYRRRATTIISSVVDEPGGRLFADYRPFLRSFLCKYPGDADSSLYLHQDWMYVDERQGDRTYVVWVALQDITGHNGQLRVLRGSHRIDPSLRGTSLNAPWIGHVDVIEPRLLSVPVRAGEAIVFDNALVHCSFSNHTDEARVAAAVAFRPATAPLVHFRQHGPGLADRYDIDEDFFCRDTPIQLIASAPDLPVVEQVVAEPLEFTPSELATRLDRGWRNQLDRVRQRRAARV